MLGKLNHDRIVTLTRAAKVGPRQALVLQYAGDTTLAETLASKRGRLSLDLLERWGGDLLDALVALDTAGINHRDIKPSNLGVRKAGNAKTETHLMLFDFSMASTGTRAITAGTPPRTTRSAGWPTSDPTRHRPRLLRPPGTTASR